MGAHCSPDDGRIDAYEGVDNVPQSDRGASSCGAEEAEPQANLLDGSC